MNFDDDDRVGNTHASLWIHVENVEPVKAQRYN